METIAEDAEKAETELELDKIRKRYTAAINSGGSVLLVSVERPSVAAGLGISLAGHKDRNKMAVLVCGVRPSGAAARLGPDAVCVGDEVLEVNGVVVQGRSHHNASAIIKGMAGPVLKIVLLRKVAGLDELAVKPITQFPVSLDDETPEERYSNFKNLKTFVIKKGSQGLGIMIIEGKHAELGQGIFISDIQEGSAAEQAGLAVGDMVLAVNGDSLVGASYDKAAGILKKTDGLTTLHVSSPHDKKEEKEEKSGDGKAPAKSPTAPAPAPEKPRSRDPSPLPPNDLNGQPTEVSPAQAVIEVGKETTIEISRENVPLGLGIVGGADTPLKAIVVHEIYPGGAAAKDNRLRVGDQILEVGTENLRTATNSKAIATLRQAPTKVKMVVYREESTENEAEILELMDIELTKKSGKGLGLSILGKKSGKGVFVSDILQGGAAEADGRLLRGDHILEVNSQDLRGATLEEAAVVLKTASGKVALKIGRIKAKTKCDESLPTEPATDEAAEPKAQDSPSINSKSPLTIRSPKRGTSVRKILTRLSFRRRKHSSSPSPPPSSPSSP